MAEDLPDIDPMDRVTGWLEKYSGVQALAGESGAYSQYPATVRKFHYSQARDNTDDLRVARLYLTGQDLADLPAPANYLAGGAYVGFYLQEVQERRTEKTQVIALNGDAYAALFFGQEPRVWSYSGVLRNTATDNWRTTMDMLYEQVFRGHKAASRRRLVQLAYDGKVVTGVMLSLVQVMSAQNEEWVQFSFEFLVSRVYDLWAATRTSVDRMERAFRGDVSLFDSAGVALPDSPYPDSYTRTTFIAPPPKIKRGKGKAKVDCLAKKPEVDRNLMDALLHPVSAIRDFTSRCSSTATRKQAIDRFAELAKKETALDQAKPSKGRSTKLAEIRREKAQMEDIQNRTAAGAREEARVADNRAALRASVKALVDAVYRGARENGTK